jgi:hypothetical protein
MSLSGKRQALTLILEANPALSSMSSYPSAMTWA